MTATDGAGEVEQGADAAHRTGSLREYRNQGSKLEVAAYSVADGDVHY